MIQEQQVKIGYMSGVTRFYYPLQSLNRLLGTELTEEEINEIKLDAPIITNFIKLEVERPMQNVPAAIFQINIE